MSDVYPPHDPDDPLGFLNALEMAVYAATTVLCPHCSAAAQMLPMSGNGWGLDVHHEPGCPDHEDNLPTPQRPGQE